MVGVVGAVEIASLSRLHSLSRTHTISLSHTHSLSLSLSHTHSLSTSLSTLTRAHQHATFHPSLKVKLEVRQPQPTILNLGSRVGSELRSGVGRAVGGVVRGGTWWYVVQRGATWCNVG